MTSWSSTCSIRSRHGLPLAGQVRFLDLETGEDVITQVEEIRASYTTAVASWCAELDRGSLGRGIERVGLTSDMPLDGRRSTT